MLKPPVAAMLTRFKEPPKPLWRWDSVRQVCLCDGRDVIRHTLVLTRKHLNIATLSMGPIQPHDVGRQLVVDVSRDGHAVDVIQDVREGRS